MYTLNKKQILIMLIATGLISLMIMSFTNNSDAQRQVVTIPKSSSSGANIESGAIKSTENLAHEGDVIINENKQYTQADAHDFFSWMSARGHFSEQERQDYAHYDNETLEKLAARGDIKAIDALADLYLDGGNSKLAAKYYEQGAIMGSTYSIEILGVLSEPGFSLEETERRPAALESLALRKVLALRGDEARAELETDALIKSYERLFDEKLVLTAAEQQDIDARAKEIYNNWQKKREEMGLGGFDNSQPLGVVKFFNLIKGGMVNK